MRRRSRPGFLKLDAATSVESKQVIYLSAENCTVWWAVYGVGLSRQEPHEYRQLKWAYGFLCRTPSGFDSLPGRAF